ncbi:hypothetical protein Tco_0937491 [Tanacetum coccineum]|uniref:Retrovirus-related Pol polyprotein from transposon TNT 1-94-like beta-barrel domain-containing protein n=1 Tax=Tanacetum coccineum TaxID=301880 RepID=A0ABQ5DEE2_9ASTR
MHSGKKLYEHIDEFYKLFGDLVNIDVDIDGKDQEFMLLTSLPYSNDNFVETLLYGRELRTFKDGEVRSSGNQGCGSSRSKSKAKGTYNPKCYICHSKDHLKKDYPKRNKKKSTRFFKQNVGHGSGMHTEGYENGDMLMEVIKEMFLEWIMDSSGSYHMTPRRHFLFDFKEFNGGMIFLGDNRACTIRGIGKGYTVKLQNGRVKVINVLPGTIKENCVYSLDGWAELGEANVAIQENESLA